MGEYTEYVFEIRKPLKISMQGKKSERRQRDAIKQILSEIKEEDLILTEFEEYQDNDAERKYKLEECNE